MLEIKNFKEEAVSMLKWLISIPSITRTKGECEIIEAIFQRLNDLDYFKKNPSHIRFIPHQNDINHSILAFIQAKNLTSNTLVILCNVDTSNDEGFGLVKSLATNSDALKSKLKEIATVNKHKQALENNDYIYGLGSFECKAPTAGLLVLLKYLSANPEILDANLLFVCTSEQLNAHQGIRECLPYINDLTKELHIKLKLALTFRPETLPNSPDRFRLYTANMGKIETCFYILGKGANPERAFTGFSPTLVASKIISAVELNPTLTEDLSNRALVPTFNYIRTHNNRSANTPSSALLSFSIPFINIDLIDLIEILKKIAAECLEQAATLIDDRHAKYALIQGNNFEGLTGDAEIISYSDLFYRASRHYRGNLASAVEGLLQNCTAEGLSSQETAKNIIERLIDLTSLPRPSIIVFFGNDFIPQQLLRRNHSEDRELYIRLNSAIEEFNSLKETKTLDIENECQPNDGCFLRPVGIDAALKTLTNESPIPINTFYNLNAPCISVTYKGGNLYSPYEYVDSDFFTQMKYLLDKLLNCLKNIR